MNLRPGWPRPGSGRHSGRQQQNRRPMIILNHLPGGGRVYQNFQFFSLAERREPLIHNGLECPRISFHALKNSDQFLAMNVIDMMLLTDTM